MASTVYYIGGISEQAIGKAAPWFVLRRDALRVCRARGLCRKLHDVHARRSLPRRERGDGGPLAKLSVSALMFDYILTGPISAVSAVRISSACSATCSALPPFHWQLNAATHPDLVKFLSALIAIGHFTLYFWRIQHQRHSRIQPEGDAHHAAHDGDGVIVIAWATVTVFMRPETQHLPPVPAR